MPLPEKAKGLIGQAIVDSATHVSMSFQGSDLQRIVNSIEREFDAAGLVVLTENDLAELLEEGNEETNYEDGQ